jgi:hypothetical protein
VVDVRKVDAAGSADLVAVAEGVAAPAAVAVGVVAVVDAAAHAAAAIAATEAENSIREAPFERAGFSMS